MVASSLIVLAPQPASAEIINAQCYALPDNASELYVLALDTSNPGPVTTVPLGRTYTGEGVAFSSVTQSIIAWRGSNDREMWSIDPLTGDETMITSQFDDQFNNLRQVQGAAVTYDRVSQTETLYVLLDDDSDFFVYEVDIATGLAANPVGPVNGDFVRPASLAIDPFDGTWYVTRDSGTRRIGTLDPSTAAVSTIVNIAGDPDAEGLDFADDGQIYTEEDRGSLGGRHIYQVNRLTGQLTVATQSIPGTGDIEGVTCNANTSVVLDPCSAVGQGNGGVGSGNIVNVSRNAGDEVIDQVVLRRSGSTYIYNSSSGWIRNSGTGEVLLDSIRLNISGSYLRLDEFNFSSADATNLGYPTGTTGVRTSENGVHTDVGDAGFESALERVFNGADLRDYLDHGSLDPAANTFSPDYNVMFDNPLDNGDFIIAIDRDGDDEFVVEALDVNGSVISNSDAVRISPNYRWNTGYAPSDQTDEAMWMTVFDVNKFNVATALTPIYGFRVDNDDGAELKIIGASDQLFVAPPAGGGIVDIQSGLWTGAGSTWSAPFGTETMTATVTAPSGTISDPGPATMDASTYSEPTVSGADAYAVTHTHGTNATLTFNFGRPVTDPVVHMGRIGGYSGSPSQSHSSYLELGGGLTWTKVAANDTHFKTTPNAVWREAGTVLDWRKTGNIGGPTWGTAAGSLQVNGTVSSVTMSITNAVPMGVADLIEFVWTGSETLPPIPPAAGCGEISTSKTSSVSAASVGQEVDWYLDGDSTGSVDVRDLVIHDRLPPQLSATGLFTGQWTPSDELIEFEIEIDGTWLTVGTFMGDHAGTYALPVGVDAVRGRWLSDVHQQLDMTNPISITTEVINPDRDGITYALPLSVQNCVSWTASNMASQDVCASIEVLENSARPEVTVWSESSGLFPGDVAQFRIRIENDWAANSDLIDPFLTDLLPAGFDYLSWTPISAGFTPTISTYQNHDGTGRELLKWDFVGHRLAPGELFDIRLLATVAAGTPPGDYLNTILGSTNDTSFDVVCAGATAVDTNDQDLDGQRSEELCQATTSAGTTVVVSSSDMVGTAFAAGDPALPHIDLLDGGGGVIGDVVNGPNLALSGTASQVSTAFGGSAALAIDGDTNGSFWAGSVTHTAKQKEPYWEVDLGSIEDLNEIVLWNRTDCCTKRLRDVWVFVSDVPFTSTKPKDLDADPNVWSKYMKGKLQVETHLSLAGATGRYVRVQLKKREYLSLAEVQVFEAITSSPCPAGLFAVYSCAAQARSNSSAAFEYEIENKGNQPVDNFVMVAMLPHIGDVGLLSAAPHLSEWRGELEAPVSVLSVPRGGTVLVTYSQSINPCRPELNGLVAGSVWPNGCTDDWGPAPADLSLVTAIRATIDFPGSSKWGGGETLRLRADIEVGQGSPNADQLGLSSFAYTVHSVSGRTWLGAVEEDPAAIVIPRSLNGIGDLVWNDANDDAIQGEDETGRNDVEVQLYSEAGVLLETVRTLFLDNDVTRPGHYWFGDIAPGVYYVKFAFPPIGLNTVLADQGLDDLVDSDADPSSMKTGLITIGSTTIDLSNDAGYFVPSGPSDCVVPSREFDPTETDAERRQVNDPRPCPG